MEPTELSYLPKPNVQAFNLFKVGQVDLYSNIFMIKLSNNISLFQYPFKIDPDKYKDDQKILKRIFFEARFKLKSYSLNIYTNNADNGLVLLKSLFNNDYLEKYQEYRDYTSEVTVAAYSKTNIKFLGWYDDENDLISTDEIYKFSMPNYSYNLEAKWDYFNISYSLDGGTNDFSNPTSYSSESTGLLLKDPTKSDYDFLGWQFNGNFVSEIDSNWLQNIELIAIWKEHFYIIVELVIILLLIN